VRSRSPERPTGAVAAVGRGAAGLLIAAATLAGTARAQSQQPAGPPANYTKQDTMIAMRDHVRLHISIYTPTDAQGPLPIMFLRTPYSIDRAGRWFTSYLKELAADQYIFVFEDIRGRYESEGQFVMQRAPTHRKDPSSIDEGTDSYDTIDWLIKNVPNNNGRVGELGISYDGWTTVMTMLDPHPALKAVSEQASPVDMFIGDDFHHNGAFRLSYGFEYATMMETDKDQARFDFDEYDTYTWYLRLGALSNADRKYLHGKIPSTSRPSTWPVGGIRRISTDRSRSSRTWRSTTPNT
jgi:predicted acyl esterase